MPIPRAQTKQLWKIVWILNRKLDMKIGLVGSPPHPPLDRPPSIKGSKVRFEILYNLLRMYLPVRTLLNVVI